MEDDVTAQFIPTDDQRKLVRAMTAYGIPQLEICAVLDISKPTLHKAFRREIDIALPEANAKVAQSLFKQATEQGSVSAAIFWLKARAGWRENEREQNMGPDGKPMKNVTIAITDPVEAAKAYQQLMSGEGDA